MTQEKENIRKISELKTLFLTLDDRGQDIALTILRSLGFQPVMSSPKETERTRKPALNVKRKVVPVQCRLWA